MINLLHQSGEVFDRHIVYSIQEKTGKAKPRDRYGRARDMGQETTHQSELERLAAMEKRAETGGGPNAIDRRHALGKLTARERLELLFDANSFVEINKLAESQAVEFGMQEKKTPGDGGGDRLWQRRRPTRICLCPGCHRVRRLCGHGPWAKKFAV
jgi:hypothetical protein